MAKEAGTTSYLFKNELVIERFWFELESNILLTQIISAVIFVFINTFQCSKIKSVWKPKDKKKFTDKYDKVEDNGDITEVVLLYKWVPGRKADFLEKLKFEFMNYTFLGSNLVHSFLLFGFSSLP
jgi:hypothetical protein